MGAAVDPFTFRQLCGHFVTGVTIVTTLDADGLPCGMTANSFASVSLDPPLISVAVDHVATIYPAMRLDRPFVVNVLSSEQEALSRRFAAGRPDRFDGIGWDRSPDGDVLLHDTLAHLCCDKWSSIDAGDHTIFIGLVTGGAVADGREPLVHFRGGYLNLKR